MRLFVLLVCCMSTAGRAEFSDFETITEFLLILVGMIVYCLAVTAREFDHVVLAHNRSVTN